MSSTATATSSGTVAGTPGRQINKPRRRYGGPLLGLVAWILGLIFFFPFLWMVLTSFHKEVDAATNPPSIAAALTLDGYRTFFGGGGGPTPWPPLVNSLAASFFSTVLVLLLAYAVYAKRRGGEELL